MSLFNRLSISASGMAAQRTRLEVMVENMANSKTTRMPTRLGTSAPVADRYIEVVANEILRPKKGDEGSRSD